MHSGLDGTSELIYPMRRGESLFDAIMQAQVTAAMNGYSGYRVVSSDGSEIPQGWPSIQPNGVARS